MVSQVLLDLHSSISGEKKIQVAFSKPTELRAELRVSPVEGPLFFEGASGQFPK